MREVACIVLATLFAFGCSRAEGDGEVKSDRLYVEDCWNGPFDLKPTFFGANPYEDTVTIRIQRGDNIEEVSDGLIVMVTDIPTIRGSQLGKPVDVGLPVGVSPPGVPLENNTNPAKVHLSLYLNDTCHAQNGTLYSIAGDITFNSLFSGDPNEDDAEDRLTDASFSATFADPRDQRPNGTYDAAVTSTVSGWFRFYFERGQPAQPFP
jgi:hypothetical protein